MNSHVSGKLGHTWMAINRPHNIMDDHEILDNHAMLWALMKFYAHPHDCMGNHDNLWVLTRITGCP